MDRKPTKISPLTPGQESQPETSRGGVRIQLLRSVSRKRSPQSATGPTEHELLRAVAQYSPIPLYVVDEDGRVLLWNPAAERLFGWREAEALGNYLPFVSAESRAEYDSLRLNALHGEGFTGVDATRHAKDGSALELSLSTVPLKDEAGNPVAVLGVAQDVTSERRAVRELHHLAHHDELTGLANRRFFTETLRAELAADPSALTLAYLDIDDFKDVNDTYGHEVGDDLLCEFSRRLAARCGSNQFVGRLGGDEFAIIYTHTSPRVARRLLHNLLIGLETPMQIDTKLLVVRPSAGVAHGQGDLDVSELLRRADLALYQSKKLSRGRYQVFDQELASAALRRVAMIEDLSHAILNNEFELHFQPIFVVDSLAVCGAEALIRWRHPTLGMLTPDRFIPLAEEAGYIYEIGEWVFEAVCRAMVDLTRSIWSQGGFMAVNVSAMQISRADLASRFAEIAEGYGLDPVRLQLELTETAMSADVDQSRLTLAELRAFGFELSLDDFGTGHSSLTLLRRSPFTSLKVDRSFVSGIGGHLEDESIISATISLAHTLGLRVIAEGVERNEQLQYLRSLGCDEVQGYLFARPMAMGDFLAFVSRHQQRRFLRRPLDRGPSQRSPMGQ